MSKGLVWPCCGLLCALDENVIIKLKGIFENIESKTLHQLYSLVEPGQLSTFIAYVNTVKSHFPRQRKIVREMYQVQSDCKLLKDIDESLENVDVDKLREYGKQ